MHYTHTLLAHSVLIQLIPAQPIRHYLSCTTYLLHYLSFDPLAHKLKPQTKPMNLNKHLVAIPNISGVIMPTKAVECGTKYRDCTKKKN